jgi:ankyrin repeat protein
VVAVELLLSNGADVHHKAKDGVTALDMAIEYKHPAVEAGLRAHIAHIAELEAEAEAAGSEAEAAAGKK